MRAIQFSSTRHRGDFLALISVGLFMLKYLADKDLTVINYLYLHFTLRNLVPKLSANGSINSVSCGVELSEIGKGLILKSFSIHVSRLIFYVLRKSYQS